MRLPSSADCHACDNFSVAGSRILMSKVYLRTLIGAFALGWVTAAGIAAALAAGPSHNPPISMGVSSTWTGDTVTHTNSDNSARQLAVAFPIMPVISKPPVFSKTPVAPNSKLVKNSAKQGQVIKISVPAGVDEAADVCQVGFKRFTAVGQQKAKELYQWVLAYHKQMSQGPIMTPLGGPYPTPSYAQSKLYYTNEGRLKTVVKR